ncbi:hypothetical protein CsSME_00024305 [Camellia sinensis var. sinensis]
MEALAVVQNYSAERVGAELLATRAKLEAERRKAVSLEFELASEKTQRELVQQACTIANKRWEEALANNDDLCNQSIKDKEEADRRIAELEKALVEENARLAFKSAAYPDLCMAAVEQFKEPVEFQMAIDAAVACSLANEGERGLGRWERPLELGVRRK